MAALQPRSVGGPAIARLTRREDRSAQLGRGPKTLAIGRQRTIGSLTGSAAFAVVQTARAELRSLSPPSTLWGALGVRSCHSLEFGQDRHFLKVLDAEARPVDARRCGAGALDARMGEHARCRYSFVPGLNRR